MTPILQVENIGKAYKRYAGEWKRVLSWFGADFAPVEKHWVLRDVSFQLAPGESVGIIGQNGAGKSTLLKIITGTARPTEGQVTVRGSLAAILELGMGFNPELTGRQNAYHAAGLMGYSRAQIREAMPRIEAFAEIDRYFDQAVRTYSTGMHVRVAFSVVTAFRPDVLIIDEALSVGDTYFQHKSFERIREFQKQGTTLLLVSHDRHAIQSICTRALLFEKGRLCMEGLPEEISDYYNALIAERESGTIRQTKLPDGRSQTISGTREATVEDIVLLDVQDLRVEIVEVAASLTLQVDIRIHVDLPRLIMGYMIKDHLGQPIYGTNTHHAKQPLSNLKANDLVRYRFHFNANLGPGNYSIATALTMDDTHLGTNYEWRDLALLFTVENRSKTFFVGSAWIEPVIEINRP
ncbi:MAG: ABC transporter ATP-binding protein [Deltaproteobacteria bacterium]|nr:ABC transporter ATP-binding protein [Deltaproteobacteria bacterium]